MLIMLLLRIPFLMETESINKVSNQRVDISHKTEYISPFSIAFRLAQAPSHSETREPSETT